MARGVTITRTAAPTSARTTTLGWSDRRGCLRSWLVLPHFDGPQAKAPQQHLQGSQGADGIDARLGA